MAADPGQAVPSEIAALVTFAELACAEGALFSKFDSIRSFDRRLRIISPKNVLIVAAIYSLTPC
jgi:hypothetical protein